jgi:hypothetical protein
MDKIQKNVIQLTKNFYVFQVRDPKYSEINFFPRIYISRESDKVIKLYVEIYESNQKTRKIVLRRLLSYNETVKDQEKYFQLLQNSEFNLAIPQSLVFLEKCVTAIKQIVEKQSGIKNVSLNAETVEGTPQLCFFGYSTSTTYLGVTVVVTGSPPIYEVDPTTWSITNSTNANARLDFVNSTQALVIKNNSSNNSTTTITSYCPQVGAWLTNTIDWSQEYSATTMTCPNQ